MKSVIAYMS